MRKSKTYRWQLIIPFLGLLLPLHFHGLDWGTPALAKSLQIFGSMENLRRQIPALLSSRDQLFERYEAALAQSGSFSDAERRAFVNKSPSELLPAWSRIPASAVLGDSRAYLIGVISDDQQTLSALSRFKPWTGQWDPQLYTYGAFYLASIGTLEGLRLIPVGLQTVRSLPALMEAPDTIALMYRWARGFSAVCNLLIALLMIYLGSRFMMLPAALAGGLFFLSSRLVVVQSHLAKPHALGVLLIILSVIVLTNRRQSPRYGLAAALLGLSAACLLTNYLAFLILPLGWLVLYPRKNRFQSLLAAALGIAAVVSMIFNPFMFLHPNAFLQKVFHHHMDVYAQGKLNLAESLLFLKHFMIHGTGLLALPLIARGIWNGLARKDSRTSLLLGLLLSYGLVDALWLRHEGVALIIVAASAYFLSLGLNGLFEKWKSSRMAVCLIGIYTAGLLAWPVQKELRDWPRYARCGTMTETGKWINENIRPGTPIGIVNGNITPATVPPFAFDNHPLIVVPNVSLKWQNTAALPPYIITAESNLSPDLKTLLPTFYHPVLDNPARAAEFFPYLPTFENMRVVIWEINERS
ncbi:MAG: hypothetical protein WC859_01000 [Elusimicrobiota bacterium]|jgi:hypothetical protein